jgi:predicted transcriptional regulator
MEKEFNLQPLKDSLYRNGFFYEEPLVVVEEALAEYGNKRMLIVIEGNRRLAALKSILESPTEFPNKEARERLENIPVVQRDNREETLPYVGFRHITGVIPWEAAAKAQYAIHLVKGGHTVEEIAQLIGNETRDISRWIRTQSLIEKAEDSGLSQNDATGKFYFSYLLTSTDAPATQKWLKLELDKDKAMIRRVDVDRFKRLWTWLYGSKEAEASPVVTESRQIHRLNRILAVSAATRELEKTGNLNRAFAHTKSREEYLAEGLGRVRSDLQDMLATVAAEGPLVEEGNQELVRTVKKEFQQVETVLATLKKSLGL